MSQRTIDKAAAEIMVMETKAMIDATKKLFYALQVKHIADFYDPDAAAISFAMSVHSIIDFEFDLMQTENELRNATVNATKGETQSENQKNMMKTFINEFCRIYERRNKKNGKKSEK